MGAGGEPDTLSPPSGGEAPPLSAPISATPGEVSAVGSGAKSAFADSAAPATLEQIIPAVEVDDISDDEQTKRKKRKTEFIGVLKLIGTNSALIALVAGYCAVGGLIFNAVEEPREIHDCKETRDVYLAALEKAVKKVDFLSSNLQLSDAERSQLYSDTMDNLRIDFQNSGWDTRNCDTMVPHWSWMGAFFFCLTVVSTIGYGHIAPITRPGRIIAMFYAIVGLPLMVMALASVGNVMAKMFKWMYNMLCCCGCCVRHRRARVRIKPPAIMWRVNAQGKPIGDGPSVLAEDSDSDLEDEGEVNIPLTVSLLVIAISLLMGAIIFSSYENWTFLDAAYYSFVSLATVGFGDLVPDFTDSTSAYCQGKMVVTWIFLVCGMALVSMCLQMMQNEVAQKVKWLSTKLKLEKEAKTLREIQEKQQKKAERKARKAADDIPKMVGDGDGNDGQLKDDDDGDESSGEDEDNDANGNKKAKIKLRRKMSAAPVGDMAAAPPPMPSSARPRSGAGSAFRPRTGGASVQMMTPMRSSARPITSGRGMVAPIAEEDYGYQE